MDGPAAHALFNSPTGVTVDGSGNVYVTDSLIPATTVTAAGNNLFRKITPAGAVSTLGGQVGVSGSSNGMGSAAQFYSLQASSFNNWGEFYLADTYNQLIRAGGIVPAKWSFNGVAISGATSSSYTIPSASFANAGSYSVAVSDAYGIVTTSPVSLTFAPSDTPTMPQWGLIVMALLLIWVAIRQRARLA